MKTVISNHIQWIEMVSNLEAIKDITVNKDFNVMANRVNDKVGKDEIINRLNLSPEGRH